jgi:hypothetical protein
LTYFFGTGRAARRVPKSKGKLFNGLAFFTRLGFDFCYNWRMKGQVQVYRNLHRTTKEGKPVYSVKNDKNRVYDWVEEIALINPLFRVSQRGNDRVRKEKRKNVHAYIQGERMGGQTGHFDKMAFHKITYNPYRHKNFVLDNDHSAIVTGGILAHIDSTGVYVLEPTLRFENLLEV